MELAEAIEKLRAELATVKASGKTEVEVKNLEAYLDALLAEAGASTELRRANHENALARYNADQALMLAKYNADAAIKLAQFNATSATHLEDFRVVLQAGKETINAAIIINGGAIIALMSFLANAAGKPGPANYLLAFAFPLLLLGSGVLFGGIAYGMRYLAQFFYAYHSTRRPINVLIGHWCSGASWVCVILSFLAFLSAVVSCYGTLLSS